MRARPRTLALTLGFAALIPAGCRLPGRPGPEPEVPRPGDVHGFAELYKQNCSACHGAQGSEGAATDLANPEYLAWVDDASLRAVISQGEKGSLMPAFALNHGGTLTESQVDVLVNGLRTAWAKPNAFGTASPPPYHPATAGTPAQGEAVYNAACARCHGSTPERPGPAGSILDPSFLTLIDARTLRTTIVAGRPDIGQPDFRNDVPSHALTEAEVSDVTAWLMAQAPASSSGSSRDAQPGGGLIAAPHTTYQK